MGKLDGISDRDLDQLLSGTAPNGGMDIDPVLARFANQVGTAFTRPLPPEAARRALTAAIEVSRLAIDKGDPAARPASKAHGPARQASGLPKWRRRTVFSTLFASLTAKIAGVAIAAAAATGGLAAAGALPAPAQQAVANAASTIGVHLPSPHAAAAGTAAKNDLQEVTGTAGAGVSETASAGVNHGNCVSYAASAADSLGLSGSAKGQFIAAVAQDSSAVSAQVSATATPDAACQTAIAAAQLAAEPTGSHGTPHGASVTGTASSSNGVSHNPTGNGPTSHPNATNHPGSSSPAAEPTDLPSPAASALAHNPTGFGPTNHPGKP